MKPIVMRDYQEGAIKRARYLVNFQNKRRILICAPCGAGKGHVIAKLMANTVEKGNRVLAIAHRTELIEDLADRVCRFGFMPGVILSGRDPHPERSVQVASIQTLARREKPVADLVIVDEAHHATAESYLDVLEHYPQAIIIGLTATPCRLGGQPLGDLFEELVEPIRTAELVERGLLVPVQGFAFDHPDLRHVKKTGGDYNGSDLAALVDIPKLRGNVVEQYLAKARGTRAIVFAINVEHSERIAAEFREHGVKALHVDGATPRDVRKAAFEAFRSGAAQVLTNCQLFTEGVDLPAIETVILARPTMSTALALQMIGRGRRPLPCPSCGEIPHWRQAACACGAPVVKRFCRLHDHASVVFNHGLPDEPREWSLKDSFAFDPGRKVAQPGSAIRTCKVCMGIYPADVERCPVCGAPNKAPKKLIRNERGVAVALDEVERAEKAKEPPSENVDQQKKYFFFLLLTELQRGYRRGWAEMRFHGRYKHFAPAKLWRAAFAEERKKKTAQPEFVPASETKEGT